MARGKKTLSKSQNFQIANLGKRIKALRKKKGFTNFDIFAYQHGIARSQYGKYEQGIDMHFSSILKLIEIHGMTVKQFFGDGFE